MKTRRRSENRNVLLLLFGLLIVLAATLALSVLRTTFEQGPRPVEPVALTADAGGPLTGRIDTIEETTESLANSLLDLSAAVRAGDASRMETFFASRLLATPFPSQPEAHRPKVKWIASHGWKLAAQTGDLWHADLVASLRGFLRHFTEVEDVRFTVKSAVASRDSARLEATIGLWLVGRDTEKRREWARGEAEATARRGDGGGWRIERLKLTSLDSLVCDRDLFDEVAGRAGLSASDPPLLEHPTLGLAAYGAAAADADRDGLVDLLVTGQSGNALYLNQGNGTFVDMASQANIGTLPSPGAAPLFLDFDNDGDEDVFISSTLGDQALFENRLIPEARLVFRDVSLPAGVSRPAVAFSAVAGDVNRDGFPDIYVTSYNRYGAVMPDSWDAARNGTPNLLFVNQGNGSFREEAAKWGVADARWSYAAEFADVDGDGDLDLYVANDFGGGNPLYLNAGDHFIDGAEARGVSDGGYAMGVSFGDADNDGDLDLHVTRMSSTAGRRILGRLSPVELPVKERLEQLASGDALYENLGSGYFRDVTTTAGPFPAGWAWGGGFLDLDNDGWLDLHVPNGFLSGSSRKDTSSLFWRQVVASRIEGAGPAADLKEFLRRQKEMFDQGFSFSGFERDMVALNLGRGRFLDVSGVSGADSISDGRAAVYADFDNDGDLDIFLRAMHGPAHLLFRNQVGQDAGWVRVALDGRRSGRDAFGATVRLKTSAGVLTRVKDGGSGYLSQSDPRLLFGLGSDARAEWLEVTWPSGLKQRFEGPVAGSSLRIVEGEPAPRPVSESRFQLPDPVPPGPHGPPP